MKTQNILLSVLLLSALLFAQGSVGKIAFFIGDVSLQKAGASEWGAAKINQPVGQGDVIKTGKSSRCEVALTDDRVLRLSESTNVTVTSPENGPATIKAKTGSVWTNVKKIAGRKNSFEVA